MEVNAKLISSTQLSSECWMVQFHGTGYCEKCEFKDKSKCGGKKIRKTGKNNLGFKVPLGKDLEGEVPDTG